MRATNHTWMVFNQSQSPAFQEMLAHLADEFGPCVLHTGMPFKAEPARLTVKQGPSYRRSSLFTRGLSWLQFTVWAAAHMLFARGRPRVLIVTNPPSMPIIGAAICRLRRLPYAVLVWDIYPDHLVAGNVLSARSPLVRIWRRAERKALRHSRVIVTIGEAMAARLRSATLGDDSHPIQVAPNWADTTRIRPLPRESNHWLRDRFQAGSLLVQYSGNIGASHGLDCLIQAAGLLRDIPDLHFVILGDGLDVGRLRSEADRLSATNVRFLPAQPWDVFPFSLAASDISIVAQREGSEELSTPSKVYSALAAGSAVLALTSNDSDLGRLVREYEVGLVCPSRTPEDIANAVRLLTADEAHLRLLQRRAREVAEQYFSSEVALKNLGHALGPLFVADLC